MQANMVLGIVPDMMGTDKLTAEMAVIVAVELIEFYLRAKVSKEDEPSWMALRKALNEFYLRAMESMNYGSSWFASWIALRKFEELRQSREKQTMARYRRGRSQRNP